MSKKSVRILSLALGVLLVVALLCACSSSKQAESGARAYDSYEYSDEGYAEIGDEEGGSSGSITDTPQDITDSSRKLIERYTYHLETKAYDTFISGLEAQIKSLGGYVESLDSHNTSSSSYVYSNYVIKIPTEKKDEFRTFIGDNANVTSSSIDTEDVTLKYIDVEARLSSLRLEQESLETLLNKSESVEDIIEVQKRLSEVIYEIERYESQKRALSAEVDYTTFDLSICEVERETVSEEESVWQRIGTNLETNFAGLGNFFKELFVGIVSLLPLWIVLGVLGVIAFVIVKLSLKASKKRKEKLEQDKKEHPEKYVPKTPPYPQYSSAVRPYPQQPYAPKPSAPAGTAQTPVTKQTEKKVENNAEKPMKTEDEKPIKKEETPSKDKKDPIE